jgi:hypothetical protein
MRTCFAVFALASGLVVLGAAPLQAEPRFVGARVNGDAVSGPEITDWQDGNVRPKLDGKELFEASNPIRWVRDTSLPIDANPAAFVEFYGGDRLAGTVIAGYTGQETLWWRQPPHVGFTPAAKLDWVDASRPEGLRLQTRWLKRVVWRPRDDTRYAPGTAFFRDGSQTTFRAARWLESGVRLLVDSESREVSYSDLAELHLPRLDSWPAWWEQAAVLTPNPEAPGAIAQFETIDGSRLTTSNARTTPLSRGGGNPEHWYSLIQPAWSLDPLFVAHRTIHTRRYFAIHEVPLSALEPTRIVQRATLASLGEPRIDRTVNGLWPASNGRPLGWSLGVHAFSEVEYERPNLPGTFRAVCGLDQSVGTGGCVRPAITWGTAGSGTGTGAETRGDAAMTGPVLVGSSSLHDSGPLALPQSPGGRMSLVVDPVLEELPEGADPLEIRDLANWGEPLFTLDPLACRQEIAKYESRAVSAWDGWTPDRSSSSALKLATQSDPGDPRTRRYWLDVSAPGSVIRLTRRLAIEPRHRWLLVSCNRFEKQTEPSVIQVLIDGRAVAEFEVPLRHAWQEAAPVLIPVDRFAGRTVEIELVQFSESAASRVEWRAIQLTDRDPQRVAVFEDEPDIAEHLALGQGLLAVSDEKPWSGTSCLRLAPGERESATFLTTAETPQGIAIRGTPKLGEYRFVRFAWRKTGGKSIAIHFAREGAFPPPDTSEPRLALRYHIGRLGQLDYGNGLKIKDAPNENWEVVTRDLFADFGDVNLTGLRLTCADGESAWFDHLYFARRQEDFESVDPGRQKRTDPLQTASDEVKRELLGWTYEPARFTELISQAAPRWSSSKIGEGLRLWKQFKGRERVLQTHPVDPKTPCVLRSAVTLPEGAPSKLKLVVTQFNPESDWLLKVKVAGEFVHEQLINAALTKNEWAEIEVDLSKFAGQTVPVELHHHPNNWSFETGYWAKIALE